MDDLKDQKELQEEAIRSYTEKSELERTLETAILGAPNLRPEEKAQYLGEFRERVLRFLTKSQVMEPVVYEEIEQALADPRAHLLVLSGEIDDHFADKYEQLAQKLSKPVTIRHNTDFEGDTGLVVVSRQAVDMSDIGVESRTDRLLRAGVPEGIIRAAGKRICSACYKKLCALAPEEAHRYEVISPFSRLLGERCAAHE